MDITKNLNNGVLEVALEGRLDTTTAPQLDEELRPFLQDADYLIFNFSKLEYISSAGLRVLLSFNKQLTFAGKAPITVTNSNEVVKEVFEVTGFTEILNIA